jgi:hypothetical protein
VWCKVCQVGTGVAILYRQERNRNTQQTLNMIFENRIESPISESSKDGQPMDGRDSGETASEGTQGQ